MEAKAKRVTIPRLLAVLKLALLSVLVAALSAQAWLGAVGATRSTTTTDDIIYVDADATGANNGTSWNKAFTSLQDALDAAVPGDQVWVAEGTYRPTVMHGGVGPRYRSFQLKNGVSLYGGFDPSVGDVGWEDRDWANNVTIASGDLGVEGDPSDNSYSVFYHPEGTNLDSSAVLDGFTVTDGHDGVGGGMHNRESSSPTVTNCTFTGNSAVQGGGMYNYGGSSPTVTNCTFEGNSASHGGGMYNSKYSSPTVTNCTFEGNSAPHGGGMYTRELSSPVVTDCTFEGNSGGAGGGIYISSSSPVLTNCTFTGNSVSAHGGGVYDESSFSALTDCTFEGNSAGFAGGGLYSQGSTLTLTNCAFAGNSSDDRGGGISNMSSLTLANCTFSVNDAGSRGGGIWNGDSPATLTNCTFSGNSADDTGGAMHNYKSSPALLNSILWGDTPDEIYNEVLSSPVVTYSDVQGDLLPGEGNINDDPRFVDADNGDLHLRADSPCIDAGNNDAPNLPLYDFEGEDRIEDRDGDGIATVDMGADEVAFPIEGLVSSNNSPKPVGRLTTFTAAVSSGRYVSYSWAFGDGEVGTGPVVGHAYAVANTYTAVVTATNSVSQLTDTTTVVIFEPQGTVYLPLVLRSMP